MNFKAILNAGKTAYQTNKAGIKTGAAMVGVPLGCYFSGEASVNTYKELEIMKNEEQVPDVKERFARVAPFWVKPFLTALGTMGLIYSSHRDSMVLLAALGAGYTLKDTAYKDLTEKVEEIAGKKKKEDIDEAIRIDKVQNNQPVEDSVYITGHGDALCYDSVLGQYFRANKDFIDNAFLKVNNDILVDGYASWGDLLYQMGRIPAEKLEPRAAELLGWGDQIKVGYSSTLADDGTPVLVIDYDIPAPGFAFDEYKSQDLHTIL